mgnify:FL=1
MSKKHDFSLFDLPSHELPLFVEQPGKKWVDYGFNNLYPDYLRDLYLGSSLQSAIVNGVSEMIVGDGLAASDWNKNEETREQWIKLQALLKGSERDLLRRVGFDLKLYGQCYVFVIWNRARTEIAEMRHVPAQTVRSGLSDGNGVVSTYYVSPRWDMVRKAEYQPVAYPAFNTDDRTEAAQIFQIKGYHPGVFYYGLPDYVGATNYIQLDREISAFHLNNIQNGLFPSMLLSMNSGIPTDEERRIVEQKINEKFSGATNAGRVLISFNESSDDQPTLTAIDTNGADGMYQFLSTECTTKILAGSRITSPLLFGIRGDGSGFGNNADELKDSYSLFTNTVVAGFQTLLLEHLDELFSVNGIDLDLYFIPLKPADFIDVEAVAVLSPEDQAKEGIEVERVQTDEPTIAIDPLVNPDVAETAAEAEASYNGAQISAALDIMIKVKEGFLTSEQAILFLVQFLNIAEADARSLFAGAATEFSTMLSKEGAGEAVAKWIVNRAEDEPKGYELIDSRKVEYTHEEPLDKLFKFASLPKGDSRTVDKEYDRDVIKVRYAYMPHVTGTSGNYTSGPKKGESYKNESRSFCKLMVAASKRGKVFRRSDLEAASDQAVNPGWGEGGAATYPIFLYKGGGSCQHFFERRTYLRKGNKKISVNEARKILREAGLPALEPNDPKVAKLPRDMADRGFVDGRGPFTTERTPN